MMKWISVEDRLPEVAGSVLMYSKYWGVNQGMRVKTEDGIEWFSETEDIFIRSEPITHWMPLPEPPK